MMKVSLIIYNVWSWLSIFKSRIFCLGRVITGGLGIGSGENWLPFLSAKGRANSR
jgi:hypothetical protein